MRLIILFLLLSFSLVKAEVIRVFAGILLFYSLSV